MAILSEEKVQELLRSDKIGSAFLNCTREHERLRLHVEEVNSIGEASSAVVDFLDRARSVMTAKKYEKFVQLLRFPLESNKLTKKIFADLRRVFDGKNRAIRSQFVSQALEADWERYRADKLRDEEFFEEDVFEHMRTGINDFIVVDMAERVEGRPEPQPYIVAVDRVIAGDVNRDNVVEYLVYRTDESTRVVLDAASYRVYKKLQSGDWTRVVYNQHRLGETPARQIWSDYKRSHENYIEKTGPISASLSDMDEVNFWDVGNRYYQLYGAFPIYWEYKTKCNYTDAQGNACDNGYVNYFVQQPQQYDANSGTKLDLQPILEQKRCPECEKNDNIFAGSRVQVEAPMSREDADLREPMGFVKVDAQALKFNDETQAKRRQQVIDFCVGINTEPMSTQAINEKQVASFFEDRKSILFRVKRNFELAHEWTLRVVAKLRYGTQFNKVWVNYGDEFYLRSESELVSQYETARKAGLPSYLLQSNRRLLADTRHRTDPQAQARVRILEDLEPYADYTVAELMLMRQQSPQSVNPVQMTIKLNFSNFIARFERENANILIFASNLSYNEKIETINKKLTDYANRELQQNREHAEQEHKLQVERLRAEAEANGAANQPGGGGKPGSEADRGSKARKGAKK